jgi:hypothetical protein
MTRPDPNPKKRRFSFVPGIENGGLMANHPPTGKRIDLWISQRIHVTGQERCIFVKVYTHGTQEPNMDMLFDKGYLAAMLDHLTGLVETTESVTTRFVSAREMVNVIRAIEDRETITDEVITGYRLFQKS